MSAEPPPLAASIESRWVLLSNQFIEIVCTAWDLTDRPITDAGADGSDIHLQEDVSEGGIRGRQLEFDLK
jgi:hypothetical protein